ncbi:MAG: phosphoribosyltransferase [Nanoarchaeota archaeon]
MDDLKGKCEVLSWESFHEASKELGNKIKQAGFQPDIIIGLARGGWAPARNMCDFLGVKDLISIKMEHWGDTATKDGNAQMKYPVKVDLIGKNVLIVDDVADTGDSLKISKEYVKTMNPKETKTATLWCFDNTPDEKLSDFYVERKTWRWIIFPWNYTEDVISLMKKMLEKYEKVHHSEIQSKMDERFDIKLDNNSVNELLEEAQRRNKIKKHDDGEHWEKV